MKTTAKLDVSDVLFLAAHIDLKIAGIWTFVYVGGALLTHFAIHPPGWVDIVGLAFGGWRAFLYGRAWRAFARASADAR